MKRIYYLLIILILLFTLCGCNEKDKEELQAVINQSVYAEDKYTTVSYEKYTKAREAAQAVIDGFFSSKKAISKAQEEFKSAADGLEFATKGIYRIDYDFDLISNDSVGSDWIKTVYLDNQNITDVNYVTAPFDTVASIKCTVIEEDKIRDVGRGSTSVTLRDGESGSVFISVRETNGRYTGNAAMWELRYSVVLTERK